MRADMLQACASALVPKIVVGVSQHRSPFSNDARRREVCTDLCIRIPIDARVDIDVPCLREVACAEASATLVFDKE